MPNDAAQNPETFVSNRDKLTLRVRYALKEAGIDIPSISLLDELVNLLIDERTEVRDQSASFVETILERATADESFTTDQLERIAYIIRYAYRDDDNEIRISFPDQEAR